MKKAKEIFNDLAEEVFLLAQMYSYIFALIFDDDNAQKYLEQINYADSSISDNLLALYGDIETMELKEAFERLGKYVDYQKVEFRNKNQL